MTETQKNEAINWAQERCEEWNWNANPAEIAHELIETNLDLDGDLFDCLDIDGPLFSILKQEFVKFFPSNGESDIEVIGQIIEVFS